MWEGMRQERSSDMARSCSRLSLSWAQVALAPQGAIEEVLRLANKLGAQGLTRKISQFWLNGEHVGWGRRAGGRVGVWGAHGWGGYSWLLAESLAHHGAAAACSPAGSR